MEFIKDPPPAGSREITLSQYAHIDMATELAARGVGGVAKCRIVWGMNPDDGLTFEIHKGGTVSCSDGYEAIISHGMITGFRKECV